MTRRDRLSDWKYDNSTLSLYLLLLSLLAHGAPGKNMKAVKATVTLMALAALAPATAFAPSAATGTAIRRSRGEYVPVVPQVRP